MIAAAIAANNIKKGTTTAKGNTKSFELTPEAKALAADFVSNKGRLIWPVQRGRVTKRFGKSRHPTLPNITIENSGVEIETLTNAQARASFKGEVDAIQAIPGGNKVVMIRHGDYITVYQNLKNLKVQKGDAVTTKQILGEVAEDLFTGRTVLKFLVFKNTKRLNPEDWILNK